MSGSQVAMDRGDTWTPDRSWRSWRPWRKAWLLGGLRRVKEAPWRFAPAFQWAGMWACWALSLKLLLTAGGHARPTWVAGGVVLLSLQFVPTAVLLWLWWDRLCSVFDWWPDVCGWRRALLLLPSTLLVDLVAAVTFTTLEAARYTGMYIRNRQKWTMCKDYVGRRAGIFALFQALPQLLWYHTYLLLYCHVMKHQCDDGRPAVVWLAACMALDLVVVLYGLVGVKEILDRFTRAMTWWPWGALVRELLDAGLYVADIAFDIWFVVQRFTTPGSPRWLQALATTFLLQQYPLSVLLLLGWNWVPQGRNKAPVGRRPLLLEALLLCRAAVVLFFTLWVVDLVAVLVLVRASFQAARASLHPSCSCCVGGAAGDRGRKLDAPMTGRTGALRGPATAKLAAAAAAAAADPESAGVIFSRCGGQQAPTSAAAASTGCASWVLGSLRHCCWFLWCTPDVRSLLLHLLPEHADAVWAENHMFTRMPLEALLEALPQLCLQVAAFFVVPNRPKRALLVLMMSATLSVISIGKSMMYAVSAGKALGASLLDTLQLLLQLEGSFRLPASELMGDAAAAHHKVAAGVLRVTVPTAWSSLAGAKPQPLTPLQQAGYVLAQVDSAARSAKSGELSGRSPAGRQQGRVRTLEVEYDELVQTGVRFGASKLQVSLAGLGGLLRQQLLRLNAVLVVKQSNQHLPLVPGAALGDAWLAHVGILTSQQQHWAAQERLAFLVGCGKWAAQSRAYVLGRYPGDGGVHAALEPTGIAALLPSIKELSIRYVAGLEQQSLGWLRHCSALRSLHFELCSGPTLLAPDFAPLPGLTQLHVEECPDLQALPLLGSGLSSLQQLCIRECPRLETLPDSLGALTSLTVLSVSYCSGIRELPATLQHLTRLQALDVTGCQELRALPEVVRHLPCLKELDLWGCNSLQRPPWLAQLQHKGLQVHDYD